MSVETMQAQLRKLQMSTAAREITEVLAKHKKSVSLDWVSELLEREIDEMECCNCMERMKKLEAEGKTNGWSVITGATTATPVAAQA